MPKSTLIIESPRETEFQNPRVERIVKSREIGSRTEQVIVCMLQLDQDSHSLPFRRHEGVDHRISADLLFALVVECSQRGVVSEGVIFRIVPAVETDLHSQYVLDDIELVIVRQYDAQFWCGDNLLIRTPLQQYPVVQMESAYTEILAGIQTRDVYGRGALRHVAQRIKIYLVAGYAVPGTYLQSIVRSCQRDLETGLILLFQRSKPCIMV